ncbi:hypothetical protein PLESTB_001367400 [Pleodorina starrii]|uniref:Protein kinase domain-containing protein n=1 Tax=Pleodorina starrii TaxID=330485 RepID=A0A9W6BU51_9CHLO|nr:hypothetical protein PLESTB_001367400 [Pleodorina starrii]
MGSCLSSENGKPPHEFNPTAPLELTTASTGAAVSGLDPSGRAAGVPTPPPAARDSSKISVTVAVSEECGSEQPQSQLRLPVSSAVHAALPTPSPTASLLPPPARPKTTPFGPPESRMSVYSDTVEVEPVADPVVTSLPPNGQLASASVTPAGNVLMHLSRAMVLRNRMGLGGGGPSASVDLVGSGSGVGTGTSGTNGMGGRILLSGALPHPNTPPPNGAEGFASPFGAGASASAYGAEGGDSGVFDVPASMVPNSGIAATNSTTTAGISNAAQPILNSNPGADYTGVSSISGVSGTLGSAVSAFTSVNSAVGGSGNFTAPVYGLGVEATLSEMQQMALIGSGGGGCVYIGRWRGCQVAIKFIVSSDDDQLTRSQREALLSRLASHPHVVQTYATSVTQLTESMFKAKDGAAGDTHPGCMTAADANISHDLLAGLTTGSWIRGEMQMAMTGGGGGGVSAVGANAAAAAGGGGAALPTIMESTRSSMGSASAPMTSSGRGGGGAGHDGVAPGSISVNHISTYESDGQMSSSSVTAGRGRAADGAAAAGGSTFPAGQTEGAVCMTTSANVSCPTSAASSSVGGAQPRSPPLKAPNGAGPHAPGPVQGASESAPTSGFDASFVRDHLGRAKYSIHEVLRQLGAHEGQFLTMVVMEYCDGGSLLAALKEGPFHRDTTSWSPRMWLRSTVRTALEIAHGMQHLHLSGLVHGDLKPGNVLLKGSNQDKRKFVAKVSDLGIAHPVGSADEMAIDDGQIGSIAFMAPEVFRGRIMKASDVYSFGVLLWQLACGTGAAPFEGAHPVAIALGVSEGKMVLRWPQGVFRPLQQLGELCLQTDPAARPSFKSVVGALEKLERHMQRLAAVAAAGPGQGQGHAAGGSGAQANSSLMSSASSVTIPTTHASPGTPGQAPVSGTPPAG